MMGKVSGIEKATLCAAAIAGEGYIAKPGADDNHAVIATAATDSMIGVFQHSTEAAEEPVRVMLSGIARVKAGGTITRGGPVTADAAGKGVASAPAAGAIGRIIGIALESTVDGNMFSMLIAPGRDAGVDA